MVASLVTAVLCAWTLAVSATALSQETASGVVIGSIVLNEEYFKSQDGLKKTKTSRVKRQAVSPDVKRELVDLIKRAIRESQIPVTPSTSSSSPPAKTVQMNDVMAMFGQSLQLLKQNGLTLTVSGKEPSSGHESRSPPPSSINVVPVNPQPTVHGPTFPVAPRHPINPNINFIPIPVNQPFQFNPHFGHIGHQRFHQSFMGPAPDMHFNMIPHHPVQPMMGVLVPYSMPTMVAG